MLWVHGTVSTKRWEPIWDVRTRPPKVQTTTMDLLKQLTELRKMSTTLPSLDTLALPRFHQLRVPFGNMNALCDAIEYIFNRNDALGVAYGGPDDRGTLWIKFFKMRVPERPLENVLQFVIWIDSLEPSGLALEDSSLLVYKPALSHRRVYLGGGV